MSGTDDPTFSDSVCPGRAAAGFDVVRCIDFGMHYLRLCRDRRTALAISRDTSTSRGHTAIRTAKPADARSALWAAANGARGAGAVAGM
jgi:hypothetical protein